MRSGNSAFGISGSRGRGTPSSGVRGRIAPEGEMAGRRPGGAIVTVTR